MEQVTPTENMLNVEDHKTPARSEVGLVNRELNEDVSAGSTSSVLSQVLVNIFNNQLKTNFKKIVKSLPVTFTSDQKLSRLVKMMRLTSTSQILNEHLKLILGKKKKKTHRTQTAFYFHQICNCKLYGLQSIKQEYNKGFRKLH